MKKYLIIVLVIIVLFCILGFLVLNLCSLILSHSETNGTISISECSLKLSKSDIAWTLKNEVKKGTPQSSLPKDFCEDATK